MTKRFLVLVLLAGCGVSADDTDGGTKSSCEELAIRDVAGEVDACDLAACETCDEACDGDCMVLESYPPQYACEDGGSWSVYDECPDWQMPEYTACDDTPAEVASDLVTPLGFSADQVLALAPDPVQADAEWMVEENRPDTVVTLAITASGPPVFHDREPGEGGTTGTLGTMAEPDDACGDYLEIPIEIHFSTADGAFDEVLASSIWAFDLTALSAGAPLDWTALEGDFTFQGIDPADWDTVSLDLQAMWLPEPVQGQINLNASRDIGPNTGEGLVGHLLRWPPLDP